MKMKNNNHNLVLKLFPGLLLGLFSGSAVYANGTGAEIVNGQVSFDQVDPTTMNITNSNGAIINWQQFSIQSNEVTRFIQDSANSAVLNRIVGQDPSSILGQLLSNGRVFLINPNGIVFGPDAIIDTAGMVASTLNITDQDFINQNLKFEGSNAADIANKGYIKAGENGDIYLIAPNIENSGVIETDGGQIVLAAGESITIASLDSDHIVFDVQAPDNEVINLGDMITNGGAARMFAGTIKHNGSINANSISVDKNGKVQLFAKADIEIATDAIITASGASGGEIKIESQGENNTGTVWNSGTIEAIGDEGKGGHVEVLGERVALLDNASIDASGETGGGEVLVGGDYQGKNEEVKNATHTFAAENTVIKADAITNGGGGKVILWADEVTQAYGNISARGGAESGDGGFIETSGKVYLDVSGSSVDASAVNGEPGMWLLDPNNIEIVAGVGTVNINGATPFVSTNDTAELGVTLITVALDGGTDVTVTTGTGGTNAQAGDITVTVPIVTLPIVDATLTLNAANDININADIISAVGKLNLVLDAGQTTATGAINLGVVGPAPPVFLGGSFGSPLTLTLTFPDETINVIAPTIIDSASIVGSVDLKTGLLFTGVITNQGSLTLSGGTIDGTGGAFTNTGTVSVSSSSTFSTLTQTAGSLIVGAGATLTTTGLIINGGSLLGDGTISGSVTNNGGILSAGSSPGTLTITGSYTQGAGGTLQAELAGTTLAGTDYDLLSVSGTASLGGTLDISLFGGFIGSVGDTFDIINASSITGDFSNVTVPTSYTFTNTPDFPAAGNYQINLNSIGIITELENTATTSVIVTVDTKKILGQGGSDGREGDGKEGDDEEQELACQ